MICQMARPADGFWYRSTICFQAEVSGWLSPWMRFEAFMIQYLVNKPQNDVRETQPGAR
jgi:hypothetical protein